MSCFCLAQREVERETDFWAIRSNVCYMDFFFESLSTT
jgi:hypothetical protein